MVPHDLIRWRVLNTEYIHTSVPFEHVVIHAPELRLIYDPAMIRLGMRLQLQPGRSWAQTNNLKNVCIRHVSVSGVPYIEVSTDSVELYRPLYFLVSDVVNRIVDGEQDSLRALELSLSDFDSLVAKSKQMSKESAVGLFGELWILLTLLESRTGTVGAWIGSRRESHDFRIGSVELEVKTTTANVRAHRVHGLNQLSPSPGHKLEIISIRINSPGKSSGLTVNSLIAEIRTILGEDHTALKRFNECLVEHGYDSEDAECLVEYQLAALPMTIAIDHDFPAISYSWLSGAIGASSASRVRDVSLTLDLEGLGKPFDASMYTE